MGGCGLDLCESGYRQKTGDVHTIIRLHKRKGISQLYEELLTFQEEKCSMELLR